MSLETPKTGIKDYFNNKSAYVRNRAVLGLIACAAISLSGSDLTPYVLIPAVLYTAGKVNKWQESAKGKPIWKPLVSKTFGLSTAAQKPATGAE